MFLPPDVLEWALNVVVVHSGGRTILIDAGMGLECPDLPRAGWTVQRLEVAGIDLASVTDVVLTHLHMVHVGGLLVDGVRDRMRPELRIHVAAAEAKFWEAPDFSRVSMPPGFPDALRRTGKRFLEEYHGQMRTFENEYEVAPGVLVQRTGGHTPGHSVVRLASGGNRLTFAGAAVFQVGFDHPDWYNGSNTTPRRGPASASVFCGNWRRTASRLWPLTCRFRPSAMWRSTATSFVGCRARGSTNRWFWLGPNENHRAMIVCSCNVLSDRDIRSAIEAERTCSISQVYGCLGCSPQCGRCAPPSAASCMRRSAASPRYPATAARRPLHRDRRPAGFLGAKTAWR